MATSFFNPTKATEVIYEHQHPESIENFNLNKVIKNVRP